MAAADKNSRNTSEEEGKCFVFASGLLGSRNTGVGGGLGEHQSLSQRHMVGVLNGSQTQRVSRNM